MKKLLFTAIALIAFSGISVANTVEEKKCLLERTESEEVSTLSPCGDIASARYEMYESNYGCVESNVYNALYDFYYSTC